MQLFEQHDTTWVLYQRYISLCIKKEFAQQQTGTLVTFSHQDSEQAHRRRELLEVEEQAKQEKAIKEHGEQHFRNQVMNKFFTKVAGEINTEFEQKENFYQSFLAIEDAAPAILEILSLRAASLNRVTPLVSSLHWLAEEAINLVNKPQYRKNADVKVTQANLAVSYIGLENLKLVMPTFILKHWLPLSTAPYPLMKRKLWNDSLSVALATRALGEAQGVDWYRAFTAGMLSNVGTLAVTRCFLEKFSDSYNREIKDAYDNRDKRLHDALVSLEQSPELLLEQLCTRSYMVGADLIEQMKFDRLPITEPLFDLAFARTTSAMSELAQLVTKAKAYVMFRTLAKDELINNDEAKQLLSVAKITPADIALLKKTDINHLKLNFS
ncbi:HDOD domain-containing protein [Thalassotalea euphylliae]|uniref:HDOD domain-containing protein n=1 Tax=Thalassotalea euphylliae TaxID=1655234 RepID=A0A3E0U2V3_9GAMM|nr:HDOD domain-containing protein [Thalassotalea euphylliae]REL30927.1 HDOD domain-containing protein [Thalassotalea euphylliae]